MNINMKDISFFKIAVIIIMAISLIGFISINDSNKKIQQSIDNLSKQQDFDDCIINVDDTNIGYKCPKCNSMNVYDEVWLNPNDDDIIELYEHDTHYCMNCKQFVDSLILSN